MAIDPNTHEFAGTYCPYCYKRLVRVIKTGFTFCPTQISCEYEVHPEGKQPITERDALTRRRADILAEIERHQNRIIGLKAAYDGYGERINKLLKEANDGK